MKIGDFIISSASEGQTTRNEDRLLVVDRKGCVLLALADGSGGSGYGGQAAQTAIEELDSLGMTDLWREELFWVDVLRRVDLAVEGSCAGGETTLMVAMLRNRKIVGASVGDSKLMLVPKNETCELTSNQRRKPLLGSGVAMPVAFASDWYDERLVMATDGLTNYIAMTDLRRICAESEMHRMPKDLVDAVRLSSGGLHDDTTVIVAVRDELVQ